MLFLVVGMWAGVASGRGAEDERLCLVLDLVPEGGRVVSRVDLGEAARWCGLRVEPERLRVWRIPGSNAVPAQFIPDAEGATAGILVLQCPPVSAPVRMVLDFSGPGVGQPAPLGQVQTRWYSVRHDPARMGGLPTALTFRAGGWEVPGLQWNDRLHHRQMGGFLLSHDRQPEIQCLSTGPVCTVVRVRARYTHPDGRRPASAPEAVYDWFYFHDEPVVWVRGSARQASAQEWHEAHFLELAFATNAFTHWAGGEPRREGEFVAGEQSHSFARWVLARRGADTLGMFAAGSMLVYDGRSYGPYLHAHAEAAWQEWSSLAWERSAWLWFGSEAAPADTLARLAATTHGVGRVRVGVERLWQRMEEQEARVRGGLVAQRPMEGWRLAQLRLLEECGRFTEALAEGGPGWPKAWMTLAAGDLRLVLEQRADGLGVLTLADAGTGRLLVEPEVSPLFEVTLRAGTNEVRLSSHQGWGQISLETERGGNTHRLRWRQARRAGLEGLEVMVRVRSYPAQHRLALELEAGGQPAPWALWQVHFPQLVVRAEDRPAQLLLPYGAGQLRELGRQPMTALHGDYPGGWLSMQLAAFYDERGGTGLYFGLHDPWGGTKRFSAEPWPGNLRAVRLAWDIPVADMGRVGNRFQSPGPAVWQILRGDWFDAALIYRDWARREARWFPKLGADGRMDTPAWMRELCAWALTGGPPEQCVPPVLELRKALGLPIGFHWYNWHQVPFDNDYPHYFPTREGFAEGVGRLQEAGVAVMPYINGRLWDTHDRGIEDWQFSSVARPAATKMQNGEPYVETYGSKETNGQMVRLAVMCPTTRLWQEKVGGVVGRLFDECGVRAVYIDQIAAAAPVLCFDASHGHPLGGGRWWNDRGYWPMLESIRARKPRENILTTECNAEPFLRWMDGYLTWHWQYDGQVPLFPVVYGGAIQMFGRAYRGGPTKDLALRMKAGQQLVWGEQLGWLDPGVVKEPQNFAFFTNAVWLRWHLRRYFYAGQMARPPWVEGEVPTVTADWQWSGPWPVTTPAVMTGAWHLPAERRLVLLFANVGEAPVSGRLRYDLSAAGLTGRRFWVRQWTAQGGAAAEPAAPRVDTVVTFPPRHVWAWEFSVRN